MRIFGTPPRNKAMPIRNPRQKECRCEMGKRGENHERWVINLILKIQSFPRQGVDLKILRVRYCLAPDAGKDLAESIRNHYPQISLTGKTANCLIAPPLLVGDDVRSLNICPVKFESPYRRLQRIINGCRPSGAYPILVVHPRLTPWAIFFRTSRAGTRESAVHLNFYLPAGGGGTRLSAPCRIICHGWPTRF